MDDSADKPLDNLAAAERNLDDKPPAPEPQPEPLFATERLRAFEDAELPSTGIEVVRINGRIERGVGSAYDKLSPARKRKYKALEKLIEAEQKRADAQTAMLQADTDYEAADADVDAADEAIVNEKHDGRA